MQTCECNMCYVRYFCDIDNFMKIFYTHTNMIERIILSRKCLDFCCYVGVLLLLNDDLILHYVSFNKNIKYVELNTDYSTLLHIYD